jgi:hypothetical protein
MTPRDARAALTIGGLCGVVATVVMSVAMLGARRAGLIEDLPPELITLAALDGAGAHKPDERTQDALAALLHMGFGSAAGALFGLSYRLARLPIPAVAQGVVYGGLVWLASYAGWVPALGIMPPPARDEPRRPVVMVLAHWVYGGVLGALVGRLSH